MACILFDKIKKPRVIKFGKNTKIIQNYVMGKLNRIIVKTKPTFKLIEIKI